jgi:uncharacterized membrane protein
MTKPARFLLLPGAFCFYLLTLLSSCTHDPVGIENIEPICFDQQVMQIITTQCGQCHNGTVEGFSVTDTQAILDMVKPGDPRGSQLYQVITNLRGENFMPPGKPLSKENRMIIEIWISQGANKVMCSTPDTSVQPPNPTSCSDSTYFVQSILTLITNKCAFCHDGNAHGDEDDVFKLNSYETIRPYARPSNPASSPLYTVLNRSGDERMPQPPYDPLSTAEKNLILKWITEGAKNNSCTAADCDTVGTIYYSKQIETLMSQNCTACHSNSVHDGNINLTSYDLVKSVAATMRNNQSLLAGVVNHSAGFSAMPLTPAPKMDQCSIRKIELWIDQGMLEKP